MTPAMMMKIEGFGVGCLEEIERELRMLDDSRPAEATVHPTPQPQPSPTHLVPESEGLTLGEKYGMNPAFYTDVDVLSVPFSVRVSNVLMRNQITTIALLLEKTEEQLFELRNFGKICLDDIAIRLLALREERRPVTRRFTQEEYRLMADGDFTFLVGEELSDSDNEFVARCIEAQAVLGEELASACLDEPEKIIPILDVIRKFNQGSALQQELRAVLEDVPAHRRNNQAVAYINTFTRHENEREMLLGLYTTPDAPLGAIVNSNNLDQASLPLA